MSECKFIFKSQARAVYSYKTSGNNNFCKVYDISYSIVGWFSHNSLPVYNIFSNTVIKHALRSCINRILFRTVLQSKPGEIKINVITSYISWVKTSQTVFHRSSAL